MIRWLTKQFLLIFETSRTSEKVSSCFHCTHTRASHRSGQAPIHYWTRRQPITMPNVTSDGERRKPARAEGGLRSRRNARGGNRAGLESGSGCSMLVGLKASQGKRPNTNLTSPSFTPWPLTAYPLLCLFLLSSFSSFFWTLRATLTSMLPFAKWQHRFLCRALRGQISSLPM